MELVQVKTPVKGTQNLFFFLIFLKPYFSLQVSVGNEKKFK